MIDDENWSGCSTIISFMQFFLNIKKIRKPFPYLCIGFIEYIDCNDKNEKYHTTEYHTRVYWKILKINSDFNY